MKPTNPIYIPLGTRCNSASIIKNGLGIEQASYPFDWIDIGLPAILEWLKVPEDKLIEYTYAYIKKLTLINKDDGTWFPHEMLYDGGENVPELWDKITNNVACKYVRRLKRLHLMLKAPSDILFLTTMPETKDGGLLTNNINTYEEIKRTIVNLVPHGRCFFVSINLFRADKQIGNGNLFHINYHIPTTDWAVYDHTITEKLKELVQ